MSVAAAGAASGVSAYGSASATASTATTALSVGISTALIPALGALATTLFPLAAVVGTLAAGAGSLVAVFGGLAATGAVTHMEELKTAFGEARTEIMELIEPLGDVFGPLLVDAVEALPTLVERILEAIGPVDQFRDAMVEYGELAMDVIPQVASAITDLARSSLPPLRRFIRYLSTNGGSAFDGMLRVTRELAPELKTFGGAVIDAIPPLTETGTIVLEVLLPALTNVVEVLTGAVETINDFVTESEGVQTTAEAFGALNERTDGLAAKVAAVGGAIGSIGVVMGGVVAKIGGLSAVMTALSYAAGAVSTAVGAISAPMLAAAAAVGSFIAIATGRFDEVVAVFNNLRRKLDSAIGSAVSWLKTSGIKLIGQGFQALGKAIRTAITNVTEWLASDGPKTITGSVETVANYLEEDAVNDLSTAASIAFDAIVTAASSLLDGLTGPNGDGSAQSSIKTVASWLRNNGPRILHAAAKTLFGVILTVADTTIGRLIRGSSSIIQSGIQSIVDWVSSLGRDDLYNAFYSVGRGIRSAVLAYLSVNGKIWNVTTRFVSDLKTYVESGQAYKDITAAFGTLLDGVESAVKAYLSLNGKIWKVTTKFVSDLKTYVESGQAYKDITAAFGTLLDGIIAVFGGLYDGLVGNSTLKDQWQKVVDWVKGTAKDKVVSAFETVADAITEALQININWPEPPEIVKKAYEGNLDIDWPDRPSLGGGSSGGGGDDSSGGGDIGFSDDPTSTDDALGGSIGDTIGDTIGGISPFASGGVAETPGIGMLAEQGPELILDAPTTDKARDSGVTVGDVGDDMERALESTDRTDDLLDRLERIESRLGDVVAETGTEVEFRDEDRWRAVER
ncbi:hypothetical protein CP557_01495 [Natrinema ejinorense]|uniref:Uncharacterized protein n=1 Tax=Natrinema ejinorense TaxID=373386 RepID=A0A2A5QR50_9EURY|nr:hypothetical protein CP557_01495 [Natrinema ejinorense]